MCVEGPVVTEGLVAVLAHTAHVGEVEVEVGLVVVVEVFYMRI